MGLCIAVAYHTYTHGVKGVAGVAAWWRGGRGGVKGVGGVKVWRGEGVAGAVA